MSPENTGSRLDKDLSDKDLIVSSSHLASNEVGELSEVEFGLNIANNAYQRWMVHCMAACGYQDLSPLDILILHQINHRNRSKRIVELCLVLNVEDTHTVVYSLKKLEKLALIKGIKRGKEKQFSISAKGETACEEYRKIREQCLISTFGILDAEKHDLKEIARVLRALSGLYDQAARSAASL